MTAENFIAAGAYETVLVIGAEKISSIVNWKDRNTCVLFGDGAGAVILQHRAGSRGLLAFDLGADGAQTSILSVPAGGCRIPITPEVIDQRLQYLQMSGKEVFKYAVNAMNRSAEECLEKAGVKPEQVRWFIPHQANFRIVDAVAQRMNVGMEHFVMNLDPLRQHLLGLHAHRAARNEYGGQARPRRLGSDGLLRRRADLGEHRAGVVIV